MCALPRRAGYVLTEDLVREIAAGAALKPHNHSLFKLEDIAMGSWIEHIQQERNIRVRILRRACSHIPATWPHPSAHDSGLET